ncbi:MAG: hypothetical protein Kapaf2KO_17750 [Candidatus Kapaibacteriales bacterium]
MDKKINTPNRIMQRPKIIGNFIFMASVVVPLFALATSALMLYSDMAAIGGMVLGMLGLALVIPHFSITWAVGRVIEKDENMLVLTGIVCAIVLAMGILFYYLYNLQMPDESLGANILKLATLIGFLRAGVYGGQSHFMLIKRKREISKGN